MSPHQRSARSRSGPPEKPSVGSTRPQNGKGTSPRRAAGIAAKRRAPPRAEIRSDSELAEADGLPRTRLQKFLAMAGVDSRRNCEEYIRTGRVTVDGHVVTDPAAPVNPDGQDVRLDGERLRRPRFRYFLLNKPRGVLCTNSDPQGRPRAIDLVPAVDQRLFTVGRLDESTEGLLLLTNDGDLAQRLAHPRFEVVRRYRCQVAGIPSDEILQQLRDGMYFSDGFFRFRGVRLLKRKGRSVMLELELREGRNREIRRLLAKVGHKVISLERIAFGPLRIGYLAPGKHRELLPSEVIALRRALTEGDRGDRPGVAAVSRPPRPGKSDSKRAPGKRRAAGRRSGRPASARPPSGKGRDRRR